MNISGLIVRARPEQHADVRDRLRVIPGVQLHLEGDGGRMILTVEDGADWSTEESLLKVHQVEGVVSASLVYQFNDDSTQANSAETQP